MAEISLKEFTDKSASDVKKAFIEGFIRGGYTKAHEELFVFTASYAHKVSSNYYEGVKFEEPECKSFDELIQKMYDELALSLLSEGTSNFDSIIRHWLAESINHIRRK